MPLAAAQRRWPHVIPDRLAHDGAVLQGPADKRDPVQSRSTGREVQLYPETMVGTVQPRGAHLATALGCLMLFLWLSHSGAATLTWDAISGNGTLEDGAGAWDGLTNTWTLDSGLNNTTWNSTTPDDAIFGGGSSGTAGTVTMGAPLVAGSITFNAPVAGLYTIDTSTFSLTLNSGITANESASIQAGVGGSLILGGNNAWSVATGKSLAATSDIDDGAGTFSLTKQGYGALTLAGSNTFGGGVTLSSGILNINNAAALGSGTFTIGGGTNANTSGAAITIAGNNAQVWGGNFAFVGPNDLDLGTGNVLLTAVRYLNVSGAKLTVGGVIDDGANSFFLVKEGDGTLVLSGANTYGGNTYPRAGILELGRDEALPNTTLWFQNRTGGSMATVDLAGHTETIGALNLSEASSAASQVGAGAQTQIIDSMGGGVLRLGGAVTYNAGPAGEQHGNSTVFANLDLNGATRTFTVEDSDQTAEEVAILGSITNSGASGGLTKAGAGTLRLSGVNAYNGATTVNGGTLIVSGGVALADAGSVSLANAAGALLKLESSETIGTLAGGGAAGGALDLGANRLTMTGANSTRFSGAISGAGGELYKQGSGALTLDGSNTFSGGVTISSGTLNINSASALGTGVLTINGGTLGNTSGDAIVNAGNNPQVWNADFAFAGTNDLDLGSGAVTLTGHRYLTVNGGNLTVRGTIDDGTNTFYFVKQGNGMLTLAGQSTYGSATFTRAGILRLGADEVLPNTTLWMQNRTGGSTAIVDLAGHVDTISILNLTAATSDAAQNGAGARTEIIDSVGGGRLKLGGTVTYYAGFAGEQHGSSMISADLDLNGATRTFAIEDSDQTTEEVVISGRITNSVGATAGMIKTGAGTLNLEGESRIPGTTVVQAGRLNVNGTLDDAMTSVKLGSTLGGSGMLRGPAIFEAGATNAPGLMTYDGGVTFSNLSVLQWELNANTNAISLRGLAFDGIDVAGGQFQAVNGSLMSLVFSNGASGVDWSDSFWANDHSWLIVDVTGAGSTNGTTTSFAIDSNYVDAQGDLLSSVWDGASFSTFFGSGGEIYLGYAVPEPSAWLLMCGGLGLLGCLYRRR